MNGKEMGELSRTSRTVCHRLVTPPPSLKVRIVSLSTSRKEKKEICKTSALVKQVRHSVVRRVPKDNIVDQPVVRGI